MAIEVQRLHPEAVLEYWPHIKPALEEGLRHGVGETPVYNWFTYLINRPDDYHLWVVLEDGEPVNITLTKWNYYDTHIALHVIATASVGKGNWKTYKEAHHELEAFAKYHNARRIEQYGRKGWLRQLPRLTGANGEKYEEAYIVMSMELNHEGQADRQDGDGSDSS